MLTLKQLHFHYPNSRPVLKSVNLSFQSGSIYGLFGKNGEGKSTLMKLASGLLQPKMGGCTLNEHPSEGRTVQSLQNLFLIPEDFELPGVSIQTYEKVHSSFYPNFSNDTFYKLIEEFKLSPKQVISRLSFGQKKKVLIALGLAANTPLLLMDEPTNGLDIPSKSQLRRILASYVDDGKCIVIATHQVRDLHSLIDHVVILDDAQVIFDASLTNVSESLWFGKASKEDESTVLFSESSFGGKAILPREDKDESEIDLELLFNGVLTEPVKINALLNSTNHD